MTGLPFAPGPPRTPQALLPADAAGTPSERPETIARQAPVAAARSSDPMNESSASYDQYIESARLAHGRGDRAGTEQALRSAIGAAESLADGHLKLVAALIKLGELKHAEGRHDEAEAQFRRALDIGERILGEDDLALVPPLTSLGALRIARGAPEEAEPLLTRALSISERTLGRDHPDLVVLLNDLSRHYLKQSAHAFAEPLLLQLYAIKRSKGDDHPEVATVLASLAAVRQALGRHDAAEQLWRRVLEIRERTLAPNHFAIATAIEHLAETCAARGKLGEALELYQRALSMRELTLGAAHPSLRLSRERIADLQLQGSEEAFDLGAARPLLGLSDWALPSAPDSTPALPSSVLSESRPGSAPVPAPPAASIPVVAPPATSRRSAAATTPATKPAPAAAPPFAASPAIAAPAAASIAGPAVAAPAVTPPAYTPTAASAPAAGAASRMETAAPFEAPATVVRTSPPRPAFTPDSDATPAMQRAADLRSEFAPEAFAEDDEEPSNLRLFAVGPQGAPGGALVMPSFNGELAAIEEELALQDEQALFGNRARSALGATALFVRTRPVPMIAVGVVAGTAAIFAMGGGSFASNRAASLPLPVPAQPTQPAALPIQDSASASLASATGSLEASSSDRAETVTPSPDRSSPTSSNTESRPSSRSTSTERASSTGGNTPTAPSLPDLAKPLSSVSTAQLDAAMRAAGGSAQPINNGPAKPAVTFSTGLLAQPTGGAVPASQAVQPALIGSMPRIAYPPALLAKGREVQGQVLVEFTVDTTGRPDMSTLSVLQSDHELFTAAVRKAVPSMRFVPAVENGRKTRAVVTKQFRFAVDR